MGIKRKLGILVLMCVIAAFTFIGFAQKEPYSVDGVVDSVWDKYKVQSTQIGGFGESSEGEPAISVDVYDKNDIPKVEKYLENNLSKDDLAQYEINVFSNKGIHY
ncbi:hypothetical protein NSA56_18010 [Oceanobacillus caeni]|uniref:Uncharacterized protein n=1 Tax=Oceanobacillus caeni TaxID=405946 RepID=A0ABR5MMF1_9BACI|nr:MULTISPECIES: hypothetical protein [Bacillaceae]KKE79454.1 hypothetical protein WH51_07220 [Bacilli bacterium VT-13-104]PZD81420.1 hypothetical protein DEJ64_17400 [Bacilli bacterium]KPH77627.1 hypothetical protein AFL42_03270 [Oceanobacillus caeni]MCR1836228.1 hypothetical protein [Oceanobacillus caeni]MED4473808.1 hypothetical protein [Oceanobacillus caeni]